MTGWLQTTNIVHIGFCETFSWLLCTYIDAQQVCCSIDFPEIVLQTNSKSYYHQCIWHFTNSIGMPNQVKLLTRLFPTMMGKAKQIFSHRTSSISSVAITVTVSWPDFQIKGKALGNKIKYHWPLTGFSVFFFLLLNLNLNFWNFPLKRKNKQQSTVLPDQKTNKNSLTSVKKFPPNKQDGSIGNGSQFFFYAPPPFFYKNWMLRGPFTVFYGIFPGVVKSFIAAPSLEIRSIREKYGSQPY